MIAIIAPILGTEPERLSKHNSYCWTVTVADVRMAWSGRGSYRFTSESAGLYMSYHNGDPDIFDEFYEN